MSPPLPERPSLQRSASAEAFPPFNAPYLPLPDDFPSLHPRTVSLSRHDGCFNGKILRYMAQDLLEKERRDEMVWWREDGRRILAVTQTAEGEVQDGQAGVGAEIAFPVATVTMQQAAVPEEGAVLEEAAMLEKAAVLKVAAVPEELSPLTTEPFPAFEDLAPPPEDSEEAADATVITLDPPTLDSALSRDLELPAKPLPLTSPSPSPSCSLEVPPHLPTDTTNIDFIKTSLIIILGLLVTSGFIHSIS